MKWSNEHLELVERRYTLINCLNRKYKAKGIELSAGFFKEQFKDLLALPSGTEIATLKGHTSYVSCLIVHTTTYCIQEVMIKPSVRGI